MSPAGKFYGSVITRDWMQVPWTGGQVHGFTGNCEVISAADVIGHDVNDRDSNWAIIVTGRQLDVVVLGCQVALVVRRHPVDGDVQLTAVTDIIEVP